MMVLLGDLEWWTTLHQMVGEVMIKGVHDWEKKFYDDQASAQGGDAGFQDSWSPNTT